MLNERHKFLCDYFIERSMCSFDLSLFSFYVSDPSPVDLLRHRPSSQLNLFASGNLRKTKCAASLIEKCISFYTSSHIASFVSSHHWFLLICICVVLLLGQWKTQKTVKRIKVYSASKDYTCRNDSRTCSFVTFFLFAVQCFMCFQSSVQNKLYQTLLINCLDFCFKYGQYAIIMSSEVKYKNELKCCLGTSTEYSERDFDDSTENHLHFLQII